MLIPQAEPVVAEAAAQGAATSPGTDVKVLGTALGVGILIDATIVRALLVPATMRLLGDWNWYLPKWLEWLPKLEHSEPAPEAPPVPAAA